MYFTKTFTIQGIAPLLMHNIQLCNPLNPIVRKMKEITAKGKKKTDADIDELSHLEFLGGLYLGEKGEPVIPGELIEAAIRGGAKKTRNGQAALAGVISDGMWPLQFDGPKKAEKLWEAGGFADVRGAVVSRARIMRTRPRFNVWSLTFDVSFEDALVNERDLVKWLETAGAYVGIGDYRPRFGRFVIAA